MPIYTWRCESCKRDDEIVRPIKEALIPVMCPVCAVPMIQQLSAAYVTPDIAPYRAVAGDRAGRWITSRREHREFLKRNRLVEIGNEKPKDTSQMRKTVTKKQIRQELGRVVPEVLRKARRARA